MRSKMERLLCLGATGDVLWLLDVTGKSELLLLSKDIFLLVSDFLDSYFLEAKGDADSGKLALVVNIEFLTSRLDRLS